MGQAEPCSLLKRANAAFRLATSRPTEGRRRAESIASEAAASSDPGAPEARVIALRGASWAARELFDHAAAARLIDEAVSIAERHGFDQRLSECLLTRSTIHLEHGRQAEANADLNHAAAIAPPEVGAEVAMILGVIEQKAGMYVAALNSYGRALELASAAQDDARFKALSNGAICASRLGRHAEARRMIDGAIDVADGLSAVYVAHATHNQAVLTAEQGNPTAALSYFDQALELWNKADLMAAEHYLEKAETFLALRLLDAADDAVRAALKDLAGRSGAALLFPEGLLLAAVIAENRGDHERAVELNERAISAFASQDRRGWWALATQAAVAARLAGGSAAADDRPSLAKAEEELARGGHIAGQMAAALTAARLAHALGDLSAAGAAYRRCDQIGRRGSALQRLQRWVALAEEADMAGDSRRVSSAARAGLRTLDQYRSTFDAIELRARAATYGEGLAASGLRCAVRAGRPERVWFWLECTRAASLVDSERFDQDQDLGQGEETEAALGRLRAATARISELQPGEDGGLAVYRDLAQAENDLRAVTWRRRRASSNEARNGGPALGESPTHADLQRIRADLGSRGLVQYGIVDGVLVAVAVTSERRVFVTLGRTEEAGAALRQMAFNLRRLGLPRAGHRAGAALAATEASLGHLDQLFTNAELKRAIKDHQQLLIVPPTDMIGIPWAGLPSFAARQVTVLPSSTAGWVTARRRPGADSHTVAFAGPNLAHAAEEAHLVAAAHHGGRAFVAADATSNVFAEQVSGAGTVHVAAHGRLRKDSPTFSSFELADGPFTVHDIQRLSAPPQRWILAACDLGASGGPSGPDLEGIVAALFSAGAGAVVAAGVPVPDHTTPKLMAALHAGLAAGLPTAQALHDAKQRLDPSDPYQRVAQLAFSCFGAG